MNAKQKSELLKFISDLGLELSPKQTLAKMAEKDALHFKPHGLCGSVAININIFDQAVKDGYKLNLITGLYEKASRRNRRAH